VVVVVGLRQGKTEGECECEFDLDVKTTLREWCLLRCRWVVLSACASASGCFLVLGVDLGSFLLLVE